MVVEKQQILYGSDVAAPTKTNHSNPESVDSGQDSLTAMRGMN